MITIFEDNGGNLYMSDGTKTLDVTASDTSLLEDALEWGNWESDHEDCGFEPDHATTTVAELNDGVWSVYLRKAGAMARRKLQLPVESLQYA